MLENLFWFIAFPFVLAFILGFMSYGFGKPAPTLPEETENASDSP